MDASDHNMMKEQCVDRSSIPLPLLHIKLGIIKNLIKALDKERNTFQLLKSKFQYIRETKINPVILNGPQIEL